MHFKSKYNLYRKIYNYFLRKALFNNRERFLKEGLPSYAGLINDYISIDIAKLINKRFKGKKIETDYSNYSLSTIEKEVQQGIYYDDVKSITINVNGNKDILLTKEHIKNSRDEIKVLLQKTGEYYEESSVRTGKGKHYKLVEKKKLKK